MEQWKYVVESIVLVFQGSRCKYIALLHTSNFVTLSWSKWWFKVLQLQSNSSLRQSLAAASHIAKSEIIFKSWFSAERGLLLFWILTFFPNVFMYVWLFELSYSCWNFDFYLVTICFLTVGYYRKTLVSHRSELLERPASRTLVKAVNCFSNDFHFNWRWWSEVVAILLEILFLSLDTLWGSYLEKSLNYI